jgi:hypothetical protein
MATNRTNDVIHRKTTMFPPDLLKKDNKSCEAAECGTKAQPVTESLSRLHDELSLLENQIDDLRGRMYCEGDAVKKVSNLNTKMRSILERL